jgi:quercetin dioxygenase-like cupin family protein
MKKKASSQAPSCDWQTSGAKAAKARTAKATAAAKPSARVHRHREDYSWSGVRTERYKCPDGTWDSVLRRTLVGLKGEHTKFHLRYFEVAPGGHTSLETHRHEHVVVVVRGRGRCRIGRKTHDVDFLDTLYIPPDAEHQLENPTDEPFGFFCVVDARRDQPTPVNK